jgi:membrane associated rhomboid family serine protease
VAVPSLLQFALPGMLDAGRRDPSAIADGEWWRLLTSMFLQDGGWLGTAFNLVTLAISLTLVGAVVRGPVMIAGFVIGGLVCNLLTIAFLDKPGAGNSMATMCLVAATAVGLWLRQGRRRESLVPTVALTVVTVVLLALRDQHGLAAATGLLAGAASLFVRPRVRV